MVRDNKQNKNIYMPLPKPNLEAIPFTPLTAEFIDDMNENIESLSYGTGFEDGSIKTSAIDNGAVTLPKINGGAIQGTIVSDGSGTVNVDTSGNFSTTEVATPHKWIDGKTIFKKTVNCGALPNNTTKNIPHGVVGPETFVDLYGMAMDSGGAVLPLPYVSMTAGAGIQLAVNGSNIQLITGTNRTTFNAHVTLFYTKVS